MDKPSYYLDFEKPLRDLTRQLEMLQEQSVESRIDLSEEITAIERRLETTRREIYAHLSPWQRVQIARHPQRPYALDYIERLFERFQEWHGDRQFSDDRALVGGTAFFGGRSVMVLAQQKGRDTKDKIARNFGMPMPEGYRKALRLMRTAEKFNLPLITFIDTPGAYPGIEAEQRHVAEAIASNLRAMAMLEVPSLSVVIGEGGSGGALGIGVTDRVLVLENSYYSVISPEGCAAILWKDAAQAPQAAAALRLDATTLHHFGVVDEIIPEPFGGAHTDPEATMQNLRQSLTRHLLPLLELDKTSLLDQRYARYRKLGVFLEPETSFA